MKAYKVVLRLLTPLHVGWLKQGNLQRTRPYVTGKALWGALTARLTRDDPKSGGNYVNIGKRVNEELAFTYFYPAVGEEVDLWPWDDPDEFAWRYLNSYASTALDYDRNTAEEGTLHETEYISPRTREGKPVYLVGYILERDGGNLAWSEALGRLQLGGERGYGWGRVEPVSKQESKEPLFGQWSVQAGTWPPELVPASPEARVLAHALAADFDDGTLHRALTDVTGPIEPLVGRETVAGDRFGMQISPARICYAPGSRAKPTTSCRIGPYGIWEAS
ncbi:MAG: RAMP superfamily CRISPR-associated protein [Anaerolineae bacterium]